MAAELEGDKYKAIANYTPGKKTSANAPIDFLVVHGDEIKLNGGDLVIILHRYIMFLFMN